MDPLTLLAVAVADEAAGEPYEGKVAVCRVMLNRMALKYESDGTATGTILKKFQFSGFWFSMVAGHYTQDEFDLIGAAVKAQKLLTEFETQPIWADCVRAVQDARTPTFKGGPQLQKLTPHTVLYYNPAVCRAPSWATPDKLDTVIFHHTFFHA